MKKNLSSILMVLVGLLTVSLSQADVITNDDQIVQGSACVGADCVDGESFGNDLLRLKQNNLRIRLVDTTAADVLDRSWSVEANSPFNGGGAFFDFEVKSFTQDTILLSDGTYIEYDCSGWPFPPVDTGRLIPAGQPSMNPNTDDCSPYQDYTREPLLKLGPGGHDGVALGSESEYAQDVVSVGKTGLTRRLMHVAEGLADTDLLIKQSLDDYPAKVAVMVQLDVIEAQIADLERVIETLSKSDFAGSGTGSFGAPMLLLLLMTFLARLYIRKPSSH